MSDTRWKRLERDVARKVGGQRIPVTGERDGQDISHPVFAFQVKSRRTIPGWLATWLAGITGTARRLDRVGVLVLHQPGTEVDDALVVLRMRDWVDLHG